MVITFAVGNYQLALSLDNKPSHTVLHVNDANEFPYYGGDPTASHESQILRDRLSDLKLKLDPRLQRSAKHVLRRVMKQGMLLSSESLNFYLNAEGAAYWDTEQIYLQTDSADDVAILQLLANQQTAVQEFGGRLGLAEQWTLFPHPRRRVLALVAHPRVILDPINQIGTSSKPIEIGGRLVSTIRKISILALNQDGRHRTYQTSIHDGRFESQVKLARGHWTIELVGETPMGPLPLAQFTVAIDRQPLTTLRERRPILRTAPIDPGQLLTNLINDSRAQFGLEPLHRNVRLDDIATQHTLDMVTHGFVGHASPHTGDVSHRLERSDLSPTSYGENIARNTSLLDVHRSLMHSVSHRLNILDPAFTDLGLGIKQEDGQWFVTELYARMDNQVGYMDPSNRPTTP